MNEEIRKKIKIARELLCDVQERIAQTHQEMFFKIDDIVGLIEDILRETKK